MNILKMKRLSTIAAMALVIVMAFGIGINTIKAAPKATTSSTPANLQPATGQSEYRNMDGTTPTSNGAAPTEAKAEGNSNAEEANTGVVGMFGLNWKLFLAQLINFAIILFVLWKWVFGPVAKGLTQRTEKIETSLADAQKIAEERQTFDSWKQAEMSQVRAEASTIISEAKKSAEQVKADMVEQTKQEQQKVIEAAQVKLEQEKQAMLESAKNELAGIVVNATEKILKQKLDSKRDAVLIDEALKEAKNEV